MKKMSASSHILIYSLKFYSRMHVGRPELSGFHFQQMRVLCTCLKRQLRLAAGIFFSLQVHNCSKSTLMIQGNQRQPVGRRDLARRCDQLKVLQITTRDKQRQDSVLSLLDRRKKRIALAKGNLTLRLSEKYSSQFVPEENYMMLSR